MRGITSFVAALIMLCASDRLKAASFNCLTDRAPDEQAICGNATLSALDDEMAVVYRSAMDAAGPRQIAIRDAQRTFLKQRRSCRAEVDCIRRLYQTRLQELKPKQYHIAIEGWSKCGAHYCMAGAKCWKAPADIEDIQRGETLCLTDAEIADYSGKIAAAPAEERLQKMQAAEAEKLFGETVSPVEQKTIDDQIAWMRREHYRNDNSLSALADRYTRNGRSVAAKTLYQRVIDEFDFRPSDYLQLYSPPYWPPPQRGSVSGNNSQRLVVILDVAYPELIKLLIAEKKYEEALEYTERGRSKQLQAVIHWKYLDGNTTENFANMNVTRMRALAQETRSTFVVYMLIFHLSEQQLYRDHTKYETATLFAWIIAPNGQIRFVPLPLDELLAVGQYVGRNPITEAMNQFTTTVPRGVVDRVVEPTSAIGSEQTANDGSVILRRLHKTLAEKLEPYLPGNPEDNVIIVPDSSLYLVPFYALTDANGKHLIERHTLSFVPSLGIYDLLRKKRSQLMHSKEPWPALVVGDPKMPELPGWLASKYGLPQLPGAEREAKAVASILRTEPLIAENASEVEIVKLMPRAQVIHFATHGLLVNSAAETLSFVSGSISADLPPGAIALARASGGPETYAGGEMPFNGFLASGKILTLTLNTELVTLSACDTARGRLDTSQFVGLPSAFLVAGARSVVMTLWSIPDAPTAELMPVFYKELVAGHAKSVALRRAILATRERYPGAQNWAAFTLIGLPD